MTDRILKQLAAELSKPDLNFTPSSMRKGVLVSVDEGPPPTVTVNIGGVDVPGLRFDRTYSPLVDDVVWLIKQGSSYFVSGALATEKWNPFVYQNSWTDYGSGYEVGAYKRDSNGFVNLMGTLNPGVTTNGIVITNLPVGYRPPAHHQFSPYGGANFILEVQSDGDIIIHNHPGGGAVLSLAGFRFPIVYI